MKCFSFLMIALFIAKLVHAQTPDMREIEQIIQAQHIQVNSSKDLDTLAAIITLKYPDSLSRVKAAYAWVTNNITYNESDGGGTQHSASAIDSVLKYKTTICAGYVNVFCLLCSKVGITCKEIDGFGRTGTQAAADVHFAVNHAWAVVWLNGKWNLTDVTWGSGYTLEGTKKFIKQTNDWYFFTEPETFILDHYPKKGEWQLLNDTVSWDAFINYPGVCLGAKENEISNCFPSQSVIRTSAGNEILFSFTSKKPLYSIVLISKQKGFQQTGLLKKREDTYYYNYKVPYEGKYDLLVDLNNNDMTKPGTYSSFIDFAYFVDADKKSN